jgi:RHS repeat-associated protein
MGCFKIQYRSENLNIFCSKPMMELGKTHIGVYKYGFNGEEKDDETYGNGNEYDLGERFYDPRLGRMLSLDPLMQQYPWQSPYAYCGNSPIGQIDINGAGGPFSENDGVGLVTNSGENSSFETIARKSIQPIRRVSRDEFIAQITYTAYNADKINQSHFTDFCGKVLFIKTWANQDKDSYIAFMIELYDNGKATFNGHTYKVSKSITQAFKEGIYPDLSQDWGYARDAMPAYSTALLSLVLADKFHTPLSHLGWKKWKYNNSRNDENSPWSGSDITAEKKMFEAFGFKTETVGGGLVGGNLIGISNQAIVKIQSEMESCKIIGVALLMNSYCANGTCDRQNNNRKKPESYMMIIGTHWVGLENISLTNARYWEYGGYTNNHASISSSAAGAIIIKSYNPKK